MVEAVRKLPAAPCAGRGHRRLVNRHCLRLRKSANGSLVAAFYWAYVWMAENFIFDLILI